MGAQPAGQLLRGGAARPGGRRAGRRRPCMPCCLRSSCTRWNRSRWSSSEASEFEPVGRGHAEQVRELALGEDDQLPELLRRHVEQVLHVLADLPVPGEDGDLGSVVAELGEHLSGGLRRCRPARLLGVAGALRDAGDAVPASVHGELERDAAGIGVGAVRGADARAVGVAAAGHVAVQRVDDRVDDRGLARARRSVDEEQSRAREVVEVDLLASQERPDAGQRELVQPHSATSAMRTRSTDSRASSGLVVRWRAWR